MTEQWESSDDDGPWTPGREQRDAYLAGLTPGVDPYREHFFANRQIFGEFYGLLVDEAGGEFKEGLDPRASNCFIGSEAQVRRQATRYLVDLGVRAFGDADQLAITCRVPASLIRQALSWAPRHRQTRFGPTAARRVARALWAAHAAAPHGHYQRFLDVALRSLRRHGTDATRDAIDELDARSEYYAVAARHGLLNIANPRNGSQMRTG